MTDSKKSSTEKNSKKTSSNSKSSPNRYSSLLLILVSIAAGFFGGWFGGQGKQISTDNTVTRQIIEGEENLVNTIAKDVGPSVVSISVTSSTVSDDFFGFGQELESESAGTGVIISSDGLIITNRHVVPQGVAQVKIIMSDGTEITDVPVVGRTNASDPLDIAFLKIPDADKYELVAAEVGDSDAVEVGDRVVAIGNALGQFQNTVTSGIISGYGRDIEAYDGGGVETLQNLFQTDAAINGGNSGGPLVNSASQIIGINVATASADNISFAIPINDVKPLIEIVLEKGKLERPYLGVRYVPLTAEVADQLNLGVEAGAYIPKGTASRPSVLAGGPGDKAGIKEEDIIIEIDGQVIDEDNTLVSVLGKRKPDETVSVVVRRGGENITLQVTLEPAPEQ
jgi:serine protease Do